MTLVPDMANYHILNTRGLEILYSYETPVCIFDGHKFLRTTERFSNTTQRHISQWIKTKPNRFVEQITQEQLEALI